MSLGLWIAVGALVWIVLAVGVALLVGRIVRQRDRQVPGDEPDAPSSETATRTSRSGPATPGPGGPPDRPA